MRSERGIRADPRRCHAEPDQGLRPEIAVDKLPAPLPHTMLDESEAPVEISGKFVRVPPSFSKDASPCSPADEMMVGQAPGRPASCQMNELYPVVAIGAMAGIPQALIDYGVFACTAIFREAPGSHEYAAVVRATIGRRVQ